MTTPAVSILVPIYKVPEKFLRKCIESTMNQTLENIEIILVDDGSPDNCGKICDEYAAQCSKIKVIHKQHNEGLSAARNSAFDVATGEYITFLDGDDNLELNACEVAYNIAIDQKVQMVFWNQYTDFPNKKVPVFSLGNSPQKFNKEGCLKLQEKVLDFNGKIAQVFSKLINREFLIKNNIKHIGELKQGAEGLVFNIQLFEYLESAYYIPECLLHYTYNENSISHSPNEENYYLIIHCLEYIYKFIQKSKNRDKLQENLYNRVLYVIITTGVTGYFNPLNKMTYRKKVIQYKKFLDEPLITEALRKANYNGLSPERKILIEFIKHRIFVFFPLIGHIRRLQLKKS